MQAAGWRSSLKWKVLAQAPRGNGDVCEVQHYHYQLIIYLTEKERVIRSRIWRNITAV